MKQRRFRAKQGVQLAWLVAASCLLIGSAAGAMAVNTSSTEAAQPAWTTPGAMALRRVSDLSSVQHQANYFSNIDCYSLSYRMVGSSTMQPGCFMPTAFGMVDINTNVGLFNGTDEAVPLVAYGPHQGILPWPKALNMLTIDPAATDGSYVSMYRNPVGALQDKRDVLGQLVSKEFHVGPELPLYDAAGHRLLINPQTIAFSDGGSWLVAETLYGRFVRINLATLDAVSFAPAFGSTGSPGLLSSEVAVSDDGRYVAIGNQVAESFKVYDLTKCPNAAMSTICPSYEYRSFADSQISGLKYIRHIRFINNGLLSFEALKSSGSGIGVYELAPTDSITSLTDYLGLGDSYTSGEGAFDYLSGTDTTENQCHVSVNSYPMLLTRDLFSAAGGHSVACSGAVINDVGSKSANYRGQVKGSPSLSALEQSQTNFIPGYVAQHRFVSSYQPRVVTVSVGGNDIEFDNMLQTCVTPHLGHNTCYDTYEDRVEVVKLIDRTVPRWTALYRQLFAESPSTRLYAIGYPQIAVDNGNCALNVQLNKSEIEFSGELVAYLNGAIQQAAIAAGIPYVDISQALAGHRLCETASYNVAVTGLTAGNDIGAFGIEVLGKESYHPTALGQELIEQSILRQTHNLTLALASTNAGNTSQTLLNAPKTGRVVNTLVPVSNLVGGSVRQGNSVTLSVDGLDNGLRANTNYVIRIDGANGSGLATLLSNSTGTLSGQVVIPVSTAPGGHTIDVTGNNQAGDPVDVTQPVYVMPTSNDADNDGTSDTYDSCPLIANSGQDSDLDGIDDVCDGFIGQPPQNGGSGGDVGTTAQVPGKPVDQSGTGPQGDSHNSDTTMLQPTPISSPVAAYFATSNKVTVADTLDTARSPSETVRIINAGDKAANQQVLGAAISRKSQRTTKTGGIHKRLPVIHWPRWMMLLFVCWLLLLFVLLYVDRNEHSNKSPRRHVRNNFIKS